ncbi:MAG: hypothetical protein GQ559_01015 [Desulfobulbaceae bacterium]|nr:hypothetical protein [Desulfobulbaceae bacterium]
MAQALNIAGKSCDVIGADPGSPLFGVPGAVCLGRRQKEIWRLVALEALCSLDACRFRLPLVSAVRRLARRSGRGILLVDAPGVVRGVAGAELVTGLVEAAAIDTILLLARNGKKLPLVNELTATSAEVYIVRPASEARQPGKRRRRRQRTGLWNAYLENAGEKRIRLSEIILLGTPPPMDAELEWQGRQIALVKGKKTLVMGEVLKNNQGYLHLCIPGSHGEIRQLLVRDARRDDRGWLGTAKPFASTALHYMPPPDIKPFPAAERNTGPSPVAGVGTGSAILVNGIFGDPLLHLRLGNQRRSLLFDLGEGSRLPARIAHQVTDVFVSHAHFDHISGFLWLLRSRIGDFPPCRVFGPPGLTGHIAGLIQGILWDRIGELGPRFEVCELHGERLHIFALQAGKRGRVDMGKRQVSDGVLFNGAIFEVRATVLEHGTPVMAYAFEHAPEFNIRKDRLTASGLNPGPWLRELKQCLAFNDGKAMIRLPDGSTALAGILADDLIRVTPRQKLVYATDLADTPANREKLTVLARDAHTFFCEAAFIEAHRDYAERTGHLTARACGEIANAAGVKYLVPFHLSRRYESAPGRIYDEVRAACSRVVEPSFPKNA